MKGPVKSSLNNPENFDILLTMHLSIFISVINQLNAQNATPATET